MKNERLASIFAQATYETRLLVSMMEAVVGPDKTDKVINSLEGEQMPEELMIAGRPLRAYSGLSDEQLTAMGLSDEDKDVYYEHFDKPPRMSEPESSDEEDETEA